MRQTPALALLSLAALSCNRQQASGARALPVFDTQVKNAVIAGEGDQETLALRKRLMDTPQDTTVRRRLAAKYEEAGYPDLAIEHLRIAHEHAPANADIAIELASKLTAQHLDTQAAQILDGLQNLSPANASRAAILTDRHGNLTAGEALHRQALAAEPTSAQRLNNLAYNLMSQRRATEAEAIFQGILRVKPSYELARNNLATLYATQLRQPEEALLHWKAISGPAAAHNNLAAVYMDAGQWMEAKAELEKALSLRFQFPEAMQNLQIVAARTDGTVELKLNRDKKDSGLSKLAKVFKQVFTTEEDITGKSKHRRSQP